MGFKIKSKGNFNNIESYLLTHRKSPLNETELIEVAEYGLKLFKNNTPSKSGKTADSWYYTITNEKHKQCIEYNNTNIQNGLNIAILVDMGHATAQGKWVSGTHYIDDTIEELCSYINNK